MPNDTTKPTPPTPPTPEEVAKIKATLRALNLENYRKARWNAIHAARQAGLIWEDIAAELGVKYPSAKRMYDLGAE